jgi:hypothetical protein
MPSTITVGADQAIQDELARLTSLQDPIDYAAHLPAVATAKFIGAPLLNEIYGLLNSRLQSLAYARPFTCGAGDAVGDPVRISADNTVTKALATTSANAKVLGFIRHKGSIGEASVPAGTTCYLDHFRYATGLTGGTAGNPVYLKDDGTFGAAAGTVAKICGVFLSVTTAFLFAVPIPVHGSDHQSGGADAIPAATTTASGLAPAATAPGAGLLSVLGIANGETVRTDKALFDATNPADLGTPDDGDSMTVARRNHVHGITTYNQADEPTTGQVPAGTIAFWTDTDDSKAYFCYNHGGTVKTVELA